MSVANLRLVYGDISEEVVRKNQPSEKLGKESVCFCADERAKVWNATIHCKNKRGHAMAGAC